MNKTISYAIGKWDDRKSLEYVPLYTPCIQEVDGVKKVIVFDPYGRQLGDPNFYDFRPTCKDDVGSNERYSVYSNTDGDTIIYREVTT